MASKPRKRSQSTSRNRVPVGAAASASELSAIPEFDRTMQALVRVPKSELDDAEQRRKQQRAAKRRK